jgi:hypothetical protein
LGGALLQHLITALDELIAQEPAADAAEERQAQDDQNGRSLTD